MYTAAEPYPPTNLVLVANGLILEATWTEPFSIKGEELSYVVSITNTETGGRREVTTNTPSYVLAEPIGQRDCALHEFIVFSRNDFSKSSNGISGRRHIPTGKTAEG